MQNLKTKNKLYLNFIYLFFLIALSISSYASPITDEDNATNNQTCHHDLGAKNYDIQPFKIGGFEHYPKYLADFVKVGFRSLEEGNTGYYLENLDSNLEYNCCTLDLHMSNIYVINTVLNQYQSTNTPIPYEIIVLKILNLYTILKESPKYKKNWIKTMQFLEPYLLSKKAATKKRKSKKKSSTDIYSVSVKSIIRLLEMSHWRLSTGLKANNEFEINQGQYRSGGLFIHPENSFRDNIIYKEKTGVTLSKPHYLEILNVRGINNDELSILRRFNHKLTMHSPTHETFEPGILDSIMQTFSTEEQKSINKYITIAPDAPEIKNLMKDFAEEFKIKGKLVEKGKLHPITFAAWIHTEIIRIAPFIDCNGKLARLWMDTFLLRHGYLAPILTNEEAYLDAVKKELNGETNAFADYIAQQIKFTTKYFPNSEDNLELELSLDKL